MSLALYVITGSGVEARGPPIPFSTFYDSPLITVTRAKKIKKGGGKKNLKSASDIWTRFGWMSYFLGKYTYNMN